MNANGALHAKYGRGRRGRTPLTPEELQAFACRAQMEPDCWRVRLTVPLTLLEQVCGRDPLTPGALFWCNFYKISESPQIEHYASYSPIDSPNPNFHRPSCFAPARLAPPEGQGPAADQKE